MTVVFVLAGVRLDMDDQRVLVSKYLAAELTLVLHRFEVRIMNFQVPRQGVIIGKRLVASSTYVFLGAMFHIHVSVELGVREEALVANLTVYCILFEMTLVMSS